MSDARTLFDKNRKLAFYRFYKWRGLFPESEQDDLLQECFTALWRACLTYNPEVAAFSTYAVKCIDQRVRNILQAKYRQKRAPAKAVPLEKLQSVISLKVVDVEAQALARLALEEARPETLAFAAGYTLKEIGRMFGRSPTRVFQRIAKNRHSIAAGV